MKITKLLGGCILYLFTAVSASAADLQPRQTHPGEKRLSVAAWYVSPGVFFGTKAKTGICISTTVIFSNNWGLGLSVKNAEYTAKNLPRAYSDGLSLFGDEPPHDRLEFNSFTLIRQFEMENPHMRFGLEMGPSWVRFITRDFIPAYSSPNSLGIKPSHEISNSYKENIGLSFRAKAETPLMRVMSLELAVFGNVNSIKSLGGVEVCVNFGRIRSKKVRPVVLNSNAQ